MLEQKVAFVAYSSRDPAVASIILEGVRRANAVAAQPIRYEPWVFNDIPGNPLISPILAKIEEAPFVVADISYLNLNVIYEVGFTVGRGKRAFLIRHAETAGDKSVAKEAGIFDTLGYHEYATAEDIRNRLTSHVDETSLPFNLTLDRKAPVYLIEPPTRTAAATMVVSRVKKAGYRYRSFMPTEDTRLAAADAVRQVAASAGVVLLLQQPDVEGADVHNVRALFVAGLAHGMNKPTLILSPAGYEAPLDIRDAVRTYRFPDDIVERVADYCPGINDHLQQADPAPIETGGLLQSMSIGDPTAENEMTTLSQYFLKTSQYDRALRGDVNLVVGRKGSGKTALFIRVRDKIRMDKRNIVVDLKPEGYQLLKLKDDILSYLTEGARQHLITAFWEYLILLEVTYKLLEKDRNTYKFNHEINELYLELDAAYRVDNFSAEGDFSERLLTLSQRISEQYSARYGRDDARKLTTQQVTELLYTHDLRKLRDRVSRYLEKKESVWVLFDNLDKGWSTQGVDVIDAIALRCLIDAGRKVEREMQRAGHLFRCIVFVRNDVYEHLMANSADYGKEMRATLDWTDPDMLREMLRLRLVSGLDGKAAEVSFEQIWPTICTSHYHGEESSTFIIDRSLMRPRNVLKIFNHARGFASNFNRARISEGDIEKGMRAYSQDLLIELDRELGDVLPSAKDLLYHFIDAPSVLDTAALHNIVREAGIEQEVAEGVVDFLLYYGVLGVRTENSDLFIFNVAYDLKALKIRAKRGGADTLYLINPAFGPALGLKEFKQEVVDLDEPALPL
ncbi:hypothetical protein MWN34_10780 [Ancylobacter sp. 6x-1]|uniref:TIR domain-containing protein n=1 Tax=Ancylobacter crimeensis TaxID=2579147 RepID=A0ABT0DBP9_9HYPH|nr:hypothetical protein [Ancylobacter crimeensis]MCK0197397.1 hypothetical protein [Ancylobacter crimeensis]